jgi:hypothetical protein
MHTPHASHLVIGIGAFGNADAPLAQLRDADLAGADDAVASRGAEAVQRAPLLEGQDALRWVSLGIFALALAALGFAERHGGLNVHRPAKGPDACIN